MNVKNEYVIPKYVTSNNLKSIRKKLNMTQSEFANIIGISKPTIERWEKTGSMVEGPIVLLIQMLDDYPEYLESIKIPKKIYPLRLFYMYKQKICSIIDVDVINQQIKVRNYTKNIMQRAFGVIENPTFEDYNDFLKSRCFPETRDKLKLELKRLNLPFYDPFLIIKKTNGRMAEDDFWIRIEE